MKTRIMKVSGSSVTYSKEYDNNDEMYADFVAVNGHKFIQTLVSDSWITNYDPALENRHEDRRSCGDMEKLNPWTSKKEKARHFNRVNKAVYVHAAFKRFRKAVESNHKPAEYLYTSLLPKSLMSPHEKRLFKEMMDVRSS